MISFTPLQHLQPEGEEEDLLQCPIKKFSMLAVLSRAQPLQCFLSKKRNGINMFFKGETKRFERLSDFLHITEDQ